MIYCQPESPLAPSYYLTSLEASHSLIPSVSIGCSKAERQAHSSIVSIGAVLLDWAQQR